MMCSKTRGVAALPTPASKLAEEEARKLESLLHGLARLLRRRLDARARELRLNRVRCEMLLHVSRNEGISQTRLAQLFDVRPITLVPPIDRLQGMGLIERRRDPSDRRIWRLHLTPAAKAMVARVRELGAVTRAEALEGLPLAEIAQAVRTLQLVRRNLLNASLRWPV